VEEGYIEFDVVVSAKDGGPQWMFGTRPFRVRAFRSAIEALHGPIPLGMSLKDAFVGLGDMIDRAAVRKILAAGGVIEEPVNLARSL
jgi:hypothetical protein